ncbi:MAG: glycosyltransferase family 4 protein [Nitrospira sp.]
MRITLVIASLQAGGAERVLSVLANHWAEHGRQVTLITLDSIDADFYPVHPEVTRIGLGLMGISSHIIAAVKNNVIRLKRLRREIRTSQPDVVLSFIDKTNTVTLAASLGLGIPVIASEHIDPRQHPIGAIWAGLRALLYPRAAAVVVLTDGVRGWAERIVRPSAVHVIPNHAPASVVESACGPEVKRSGGTIAAMGRLSPQKGFDLLLRAFSLCAKLYPEWSLIILGEGEERGRLERLTHELGIKDRVVLPGCVSDPAKVLREVDLFVLASRYEGFPMALVEAMACKLPVISTDCPSGPKEIIRNGVDGMLVPPNDIDALAAAMNRLMADREERDRLGARAGEIVERFSIERIMPMWDELFTQAAYGRTHRQIRQNLNRTSAV